MNNQTVAERLGLICRYLNLKESNQQTELAKILEYSQQMMSLLLSGKNQPSSSFYKKVKTHLPQINVTWLETGGGEMLNTAQETQQQKKYIDIYVYVERVEEENGFLKEEIKFLRNLITNQSPTSQLTAR